MSPVFLGEATVFLHANEEKQIKDGVKFLQDQKIKNIVVVGGTNSLEASDFMSKNNIKIGSIACFIIN